MGLGPRLGRHPEPGAHRPCRLRPGQPGRRLGRVRLRGGAEAARQEALAPRRRRRDRDAPGRARARLRGHRRRERGQAEGATRERPPGRQRERLPGRLPALGPRRPGSDPRGRVGRPSPDVHQTETHSPPLAVDDRPLVPKTASAAPSVAADERIINRELSLLDFNGRVLELAADPPVPLLERVNFCAILSSNLDEFFMVRVAGLMDQAASGLAAPSSDGRTALQTLAEARERVIALSRTQSKLWATELCPALAAHGIEVARIDELSKKELDDLQRRFERDVYPVLTPLAVGPGQPFPYISGLSLSLGVFVRDPETDEERFSRVKVPETLPRFLETGRRNVLVPLESVIAHFLPRLFPEMEILERS